MAGLGPPVIRTSHPLTFLNEMIPSMVSELISSNEVQRLLLRFTTITARRPGNPCFLELFGRFSMSEFGHKTRLHFQKASSTQAYFSRFAL